jgi:hypothetical protein
MREEARDLAMSDEWKPATAMAESGGVLHRDFACKLALMDDLRRICLATEIASIELRIQRDESLRIVNMETTTSKARILALPRRLDL